MASRISKNISIDLLSAEAAPLPRAYPVSERNLIEVYFSARALLVLVFLLLIFMMATRQVAGAMGKIVTLGSERALQSVDGDLHMAVGGKFIIAVQGSASVVDKLAYARAIDVAALSKH